MTSKTSRKRLIDNIIAYLWPGDLGRSVSFRDNTSSIYSYTDFVYTAFKDTVVAVHHECTDPHKVIYVSTTSEVPLEDMHIEKLYGILCPMFKQEYMSRLAPEPEDYFKSFEDKTSATTSITALVKYTDGPDYSL